MTRRAGARVLPVTLVLVVLGAGWQVAARTVANPRLLPTPARVAGQAWAHRDALAEHTAATLGVTAAGFAVSVAVAWALALLADLVPGVGRGLVPVLVASQTVPVVALAPLVVLWFGFGLAPKVLVVTLVTFFPLVVGLVEGLRAPGPGAAALLTSMGASRWQQLRWVRLPAALPRFFTALRIAVTYAVVGAVFAEYVGAVRGLGTYLNMQRAAFRTDLVLASVALCALVSVTLYGLTWALERVVVPWARPRAVGRG